MPLSTIIRIMLETRNLLNLLAQLIVMFVKSDTIKSGSDLPKSPELLPLKGKMISPSLLISI